LALRRKRKFLWDVRSLWYDQKVIIDDRKDSKFTSFFARRLERFAARNASAVNTLAEPLLYVLESRNRRIPELRTVIPTCVDTLKFAYQESVRTEKTILLSGTLNNFYDIASTKNLIKAFHAAGFRIEWAKGAESNQSNLDEDFVVTTHLIYSEMPAKVSQASFGMAICRTDCSDVLKGVMPTKIAEFLAVGRPVIISPGMGDLDRLISETKTGILVRKGMTEADVVQEAIDLLKDNELSQRCRNLAESYFSINRAILKYSDIYRRMLVQN